LVGILEVTTSAYSVRHSDCTAGASAYPAAAFVAAALVGIQVAAAATGTMVAAAATGTMVAAAGAFLVDQRTRPCSTHPAA